MTTQNTLFVNQITENTPVDKIITYMLGVQDPGSAQEWRTSSDLRRSVYLKSMPHVCFIILIFSRGPEKRTHIIGAVPISVISSPQFIILHEILLSHRPIRAKTVKAPHF